MFFLNLTEIKIDIIPESIIFLMWLMNFPNIGIKLELFNFSFYFYIGQRG